MVMGATAFKEIDMESSFFIAGRDNEIPEPYQRKGSVFWSFPSASARFAAGT